MKWRKANPVIFISALFLLIIFCSDKSTAPLSQLSTDIDISQLVSGEVKKVNDAPLLVMKYSGGYGFTEHVQSVLDAVNSDEQDEGSSLEENGACSCFAALGDPESRIFGRNYDFDHRACLILYTDPPGGYSSVSVVDLYFCGFTSNVSAGSIQNSQIVKNMPYYPFDGINEKGVAIGLMAVPQAEAPYDPDKVTLNCLEIIRLVLDFAASTDEAVSLINKVNYKVDDIPVHFLIADAAGTASLVEFCGGNLVVLSNSDNDYHMATNFIIWGSDEEIRSHCERYSILETNLKLKNGRYDTETAFHLLEMVSQSTTMWSAVYNLSTRGISIATNGDYNYLYNLKLP